MSSSYSPGRAVGEGDLGADVGHVDDCACSCVFSCILDQLVSDLRLISNVLTADLVSTQAKRSALSRASGARTPADRADARCTMLARRIAKSSASHLVLVADQRSSSTTAVGSLSA